MSSPTMMPMSLAEIAQAVQGRLIAGTAAVNVPAATSAFTDSRRSLKVRFSWRLPENVWTVTITCRA